MPRVCDVRVRALPPIANHTPVVVCTHEPRRTKAQGKSVHTFDPAVIAQLAHDTRALHKSAIVNPCPAAPALQVQAQSGTGQTLYFANHSRA